MIISKLFSVILKLRLIPSRHFALVTDISVHLIELRNIVEQLIILSDDSYSGKCWLLVSSLPTSFHE